LTVRNGHCVTNKKKRLDHIQIGYMNKRTNETCLDMFFTTACKKEKGVTNLKV